MYKKCFTKLDPGFCTGKTVEPWFCLSPRTHTQDLVLYNPRVALDAYVYDLAGQIFIVPDRSWDDLFWCNLSVISVNKFVCINFSYTTDKANMIAFISRSA